MRHQGEVLEKLDFGYFISRNHFQDLRSDGMDIENVVFHLVKMAKWWRVEWLGVYNNIERNR